MISLLPPFNPTFPIPCMKISLWSDCHSLAVQTLIIAA